MSKKLRLLSLCLCLALAVTMLGACGPKENGGDTATTDGEDITIKIGCWPIKESQPEDYKLWEEYKKTFEEKYPNIHIETDEWAFTSDTYLPLAAGGQLPNMYRVPYTEPQKIINSGYAKDVTQFVKDHGYDTGIQEASLELVTKDGKYYGIPYSGYMVGMTYNAKLFEEAGLVDENGVPTYPDTWEEVAEMGQIIKEKTGKKGVGIATKDSWGGWQFLEIAWAYGVEFMKQNEDGSWTATFDSPEMVEAMQYLSDLKWKYDILPENILIDRDEIQAELAKGEVAMMEGGSAETTPKLQGYGIAKDGLGCGPIPAGPKGRFSQFGGDVYMFSLETTDAQVEACMKFIEHIGLGVTPTDDFKDAYEKKFKAKADEGYGVDKERYLIWTNPEKVAFCEEIGEKYMNVNPKYAQDVMTEDTTMMAEPPMNAQQLYSAIGSVMQEVLNNKNADIPALVKKCNDNFQKDFLDKAE